MRRSARFAALVLTVAGLLAPSAALAEGCSLPDALSPCNPQPEPQPEPQPQPKPQPEQKPAPDVAAAARRLLELVNRDRRAAGAPPLTMRDDVVSIAARHSEAMASRRDIWHNDSYFTAETRRRLNASRLGENVAMNSDVDDAHRRLMASSGHRANILDAGFRVVGIAVAADERGVLYITENFVAPASTTAAPAAGTAAAAPPAARPASRRTARPVPAAPATDVARSAPAGTPVPAPVADAAPAPAPTPETAPAETTEPAEARTPVAPARPASLPEVPAVAFAGLSLAGVAAAAARRLRRAALPEPRFA